MATDVEVMSFFGRVGARRPQTRFRALIGYSGGFGAFRTAV